MVLSVAWELSLEIASQAGMGKAHIFTEGQNPGFPGGVGQNREGDHVLVPTMHISVGIIPCIGLSEHSVSELSASKGSLFVQNLFLALLET